MYSSRITLAAAVVCLATCVAAAAETRIDTQVRGRAGYATMAVPKASPTTIAISKQGQGVGGEQATVSKREPHYYNASRPLVNPAVTNHKQDAADSND